MGVNESHKHCHRRQSAGGSTRNLDCVYVYVPSPEQKKTKWQQSDHQWLHSAATCRHLLHVTDSVQFQTSNLQMPSLSVTALKSKPVLYTGFLWGWRHVCHSKDGTKCGMFQHYQPTIKSQSKHNSRSQWPGGLRRGSAAARLLGLWVRVPPREGAWILLCVVRWYRSLRRADPSSRGVIPSVVCLSMIVKPRQWGGLGTLGGGRDVAPR